MTVTPATDSRQTGEQRRPRARRCGCPRPPDLRQPTQTSSISAAGTPARETAASIAIAARSSARTPESEPSRRPTGVRTAESTTARDIFSSPGYSTERARRPEAARGDQRRRRRARAARSPPRPRRRGAPESGRHGGLLDSARRVDPGARTRRAAHRTHLTSAAGLGDDPRLVPSVRTSIPAGPISVGPTTAPVAGRRAASRGRGRYPERAAERRDPLGRRGVRRPESRRRPHCRVRRRVDPVERVLAVIQDPDVGTVEHEACRPVADGNAYTRRLVAGFTRSIARPGSSATQSAPPPAQRYGTVVSSPICAATRFDPGLIGRRRSPESCRPDCALTRSDRPDRNRNRDAGRHLPGRERDALHLALPHACDPGRTEAHRERVLRVRDRSAGADPERRGAGKGRHGRRQRFDRDDPHGTERLPTGPREPPRSRAWKNQPDPVAAAARSAGGEYQRATGRRSSQHRRSNALSGRRPDDQRRPPGLSCDQRPRRRGQGRMRTGKRRDDQGKSKHRAKLARNPY